VTYLLKRTSKHPDSPFRITVDDPEPGSEDAGFARGGSYLIGPGDDPIQIGEAAAAAIMGDPELAKHFETTPPWTPRRAKAAEKAIAEAAEAEAAPKGTQKAANGGKGRN
jgi:hypothetical protein